MPLADARAMFQDLQVEKEIPGQDERLLKAIGHWCIRYTPAVALDLPDGLHLDISGCSHLWGGEAGYYEELTTRIQSLGYHIHAAIANTMDSARAIARYGNSSQLIEPGK